MSLDGSILVDWESHPEVVRAAASEQAIALTFDVAVLDDPAPTAGQFTVNVVSGDGTTGTVSVSSVSVNGEVLTLELGAELASRETVTVDYAHDDDTPLKRNGDGGDLAPDFTGQAVAVLEPPGAVSNLEVIAEPGSKALLATWDAVDGATLYKLRWRAVRWGVPGGQCGHRQRPHRGRHRIGLRPVGGAAARLQRRWLRT